MRRAILMHRPGCGNWTRITGPKRRTALRTRLTRSTRITRISCSDRWSTRLQRKPRCQRTNSPSTSSCWGRSTRSWRQPLNSEPASRMSKVWLLGVSMVTKTSWDWCKMDSRSPPLLKFETWRSQSWYNMGTRLSWKGGERMKNKNCKGFINEWRKIWTRIAT